MLRVGGGIHKSQLLSTLHFFTFAKSVGSLATLKGSSLWVGIQWPKVFSVFWLNIWPLGTAVAERENAKASKNVFMYLTATHISSSDLVQGPTLTARKSGKYCLHLCSQEMMETHSTVSVYLSTLLSPSFLEIILNFWFQAIFPIDPMSVLLRDIFVRK